MYLYNKNSQESRAYFERENRSLLLKCWKERENVIPQAQIELRSVNLPKWLAIWLGVADTLVEARTLMQRDPLPCCRYLILDSRTGEKQFVEDVRKAS